MSGKIELGCLFVESDWAVDAIWVVIAYEANRFVEMHQVLPEVTVSRFSVQIESVAKDKMSAAIEYGHTAFFEWRTFGA